MILVTSANGKTGQHIIAKLKAKGQKIRALSRHLPANPDGGIESITGDMNDPAVLSRAVEGVDAVIHIGPTLHPREVAIGTMMIDTARKAKVRKFVFMSVIHPQIDDLANHQNKLRIEGHLVHSRVDWTILQPQHYMQNIDVKRVVADKSVAQPFGEDITLGHVDLRDVAEVAAKVVTEDGHKWASYELSAQDLLSTRDIARIISEVSGVEISAEKIEPEKVVEYFSFAREADGGCSDRTAHGLRRLFSYYNHYGITGNSNVLTWLLGRAPASFAEYCQAQLSG